MGRISRQLDELRHGDEARTGKSTLREEYSEGELNGYSAHAQRFDAAGGMVDKKGKGKKGGTVTAR